MENTTDDSQKFMSHHDIFGKWYQMISTDQELEIELTNVFQMQYSSSTTMKTEFTQQTLEALDSNNIRLKSSFTAPNAISSLLKLLTPW